MIAPTEGDGLDDILCVFGDDDANGHLPVVGAIGCVECPASSIKAYFAMDAGTQFVYKSLSIRRNITSCIGFFEHGKDMSHKLSPVMYGSKRPGPRPSFRYSDRGGCCDNSPRLESRGLLRQRRRHPVTFVPEGHALALHKNVLGGIDISIFDVAAEGANGGMWAQTFSSQVFYCKQFTCQEGFPIALFSHSRVTVISGMPERRFDILQWQAQETESKQGHGLAGQFGHDGQIEPEHSVLYARGVSGPPALESILPGGNHLGQRVAALTCQAHDLRRLQQDGQWNRAKTCVNGVVIVYLHLDGQARLSVVFQQSRKESGHMLLERASDRTWRDARANGFDIDHLLSAIDSRVEWIGKGDTPGCIDEWFSRWSVRDQLFVASERDERFSILIGQHVQPFQEHLTVDNTLSLDRAERLTRVVMPIPEAEVALNCIAATV